MKTIHLSHFLNQSITGTSLYRNKNYNKDEQYQVLNFFAHQTCKFIYIKWITRTHNIHIARSHSLLCTYTQSHRQTHTLMIYKKYIHCYTQNVLTILRPDFVLATEDWMNRNSILYFSKSKLARSSSLAVSSTRWWSSGMKNSNEMVLVLSQLHFRVREDKGTLSQEFFLGTYYLH